MSKTIDEKVVSMKFDNRQFESNVKTTLSTLDKLKQSLKFDGASKGLSNVGVAAKNCDLSPLARSAEAVRVKFSALEVMGVTALANITNSAVNAGKRITNALTIEPVTTGFKEYELKMGSVQTIMASTGADLETVNKYLEELNEYSDQTIYSFSDMTTNIGKFTNAGVKLEDAVTAIKGISNEAAISGANANEASRAMYNFAQALSKGYVQLIDWKSIELANMATVDFKEQLIQTAVEVGTLSKASDGLYETLSGNTLSATQNFTDSLQDEWMTTEVLIETLKDYADTNTDIGKRATEAATEVKTATQLFDTLKESAQSGWAQSWEIIVGDFYEAKDLFTKINNVVGDWISKSAESRNNLLSGVLDSNWDKLAKKVEDAGVPLEKFQEALIETGKTHGVITDKMIEEEGGFVKSLKKGWLSTDIITETLRGFTGGVGDATDKLEKFQKIVDKVWKGEFGNGQKRIEAITEAGYDYAEVQELVNKSVNGYRLKIEDLSDAQLKNIGYTDEEIKKLRELADQAEKTGTPLNELIEDIENPGGRALLFEAISHIMEEFGKVLKVVKDTWNEVFGDFPSTEDVIKNIIDKIHEFAMNIEITDTALENISETIKGFFNALKLAAIFSSSAFSFFNKLVTVVLNILQLDLLGLTARIGKLITKFHDYLTKNNELTQYMVKMGNQFLDYVEKIGSGIVTWIKNFTQLEPVQKLFSNIATAFNDMCSSLLGWIIDLGKIFASFVDDIRSLEHVSLEDIWGAFLNMWAKLADNFSRFGNIFKAPIEALKAFKDYILNYLGIAGDGLSGFGKKLWDFINGLGIGFAEITTIIGGVVMFKAIKELTKVLDFFAQTFLSIPQGITKIAKSISGMFDTFGEAKIIEAKSVAIRNVAISIGILAASLFVLSKLEWGEIGKGLVALLGIVGILAGVAVGLVFFTKKMGQIDLTLEKGALSLLALAGSLILIVTALKMLDGLNGDNVWRNLGVLGAATAGLALIAGLLGKYVPQLSKGSFFLIGTATAVLILAKAIEKIDEIDIHNPMRTIGLILAMLLGLTLISKACKGISVGSMFGVLAVSLALNVFIRAINAITKLDAGAVYASLDRIVTIVGLFSVLMIASKFAGQYALRAGVGIIAMSGALFLVIGAIKMVSKISQTELEKAVDAVSKLMLVFGAIVALSYFAGKHAVQAGGMLLLVSGAMVILAGALVIVSHIKPDGLDAAVTAVSKLMIIFSLLIAASHFAAKSTATVTAIIIAIGLLVIALGMLSMIDPKDLKAATLALSSVTAVFALLVAATNYMKTDTILKSIGMLTSLVIVVGLLATIIGLLSQVGVGSTIGVAASLSMLLLGLAGACAILSLCAPFVTGAIVTMYAMTGVVALLAIIIGALAALDVGPTLEIAGSLSMLLLALSAACAILTLCGPTATAAIPLAYAMVGVVALLALIIGTMSAIPAVGSTIENAKSLSLLLLALSAACWVLAQAGVIGAAAVPGAIALLEVLAVVSAILLTIGGILSLIPGSEETIDKIGNILEKIGNAIGSFFGGLVGGFIDAAFLSLIPILGTRLTEFMTNVQGFIDGAKAVDQSVIDGVGRLVKCILMITGAEFLNALTSKIAGENSMTGFTEGLKAFAKGIVEYAKAVSGLTEDDVAKINLSADAGRALAAMADAIPNEGGWAATIMGENDMVTFGNKIVSFASSLIKYAQAVKDLTKEDAERIKLSAEAGTALANLNGAIPNEGGWAATILGDNDMAVFGKKIVAFGSSLMAYATVIASIKKDDASRITMSAEAGTALAELNGAIPNEGGWAAAIMGENDMAAFGKSLVVFGKGLMDYCTSVADIDDDDITAITKSKDAMTALLEVAKLIPNQGGIKSWFTGDQDLVAFGNGMSSIARALVNYKSAIATISEDDVDKIKNSKDAVEAMGDVSKKVPKDGDKTQYISTFGSGMSSLGTNLMSYVASVRALTETDIDAVKNSKTAIEHMAQAAGKIPNSGGVGGWLFGDNANLYVFGDNMVYFAGRLMEYAKKVKDITDEDVTAINNSTKAMSAMGKAAGKVPNSGGVGGWLFGDNTNLYTFSDNMVYFASRVMDYANYVSGITDDDVTAIGLSATAMEAMGKAAGKVPNSGGVGGWLFGENDSIASFGANMAGFASSLMTYISKVKGITDEDVAAVTTSANGMEALAKAASKMPAALQGFDSEATATAIDQLSAMIDLAKGASQINFEGLGTFAISLEKLGKTGVSKFINAFTDSKAKLSKAGGEMLESLISGIKIKMPQIDSIFDKTMQNVLNSIAKTTDKFNTNGKKLMLAFISGIKSSDDGAVKTVKTIVSDMVSAIKDYHSNFVSAGEYLAEGFIDGIENLIDDVKAEAVAMAKAAAKALEDELGIASPSKRTYAIGEFTGMGFVNALSDYESITSKAGTRVGNSAISGISNAIAKVKDLVIDGIDDQPTIRPVLDLSDISSGVRTIDGMFSMTPSVGVLSNIGSVSAMMNTNQNGVNDDIVSAIESLGDKIGQPSGDTYMIDGVTYDDGSNITDAVKSIIRAARVERRS